MNKAPASCLMNSAINARWVLGVLFTRDRGLYQPIVHFRNRLPRLSISVFHAIGYHMRSVYMRVYQPNFFVSEITAFWLQIIIIRFIRWSKFDQSTALTECTPILSAQNTAVWATYCTVYNICSAARWQSIYTGCSTVLAVEYQSGHEIALQRSVFYGGC